VTARRLSSGMLIVMRDGNRIESGNHEALMYKSCLYFWGGNTVLFCALLEMRKYSPAASRNNTDDTLDETLHCGRCPAIVQRRVHSLINL
jgi:hypothetical protein